MLATARYISSISTTSRMSEASCFSTVPRSPARVPMCQKAMSRPCAQSPHRVQLTRCRAAKVRTDRGSGVAASTGPLSGAGGATWPNRATRLFCRAPWAAWLARLPGYGGGGYKSAGGQLSVCCVGQPRLSIMRRLAVLAEVAAPAFPSVTE